MENGEWTHRPHLESRRVTGSLKEASHGESSRQRSSPTGVRRAFPVLRPIVSSSAYLGGTIPRANKSLIGGLSTVFLQRVNNPMLHIVSSSLG